MFEVVAISYSIFVLFKDAMFAEKISLKRYHKIKSAVGLINAYISLVMMFVAHFRNIEANSLVFGLLFAVTLQSVSEAFGSMEIAERMDKIRRMKKKQRLTEKYDNMENNIVNEIEIYRNKKVI